MLVCKFDSHKHMKPETDKCLSALNCSPFINMHLIQEIHHNFKEVQLNDVDGVQQWDSEGERSNRPSFSLIWRQLGEIGTRIKSMNMLLLADFTLSIHTSLCSSNDTLFSVCTASPKAEWILRLYELLVK